MNIKILPFIFACFTITLLNSNQLLAQSNDYELLVETCLNTSLSPEGTTIQVQSPDGNYNESIVVDQLGIAHFYNVPSGENILSCSMQGYYSHVETLLIQGTTIREVTMLEIKCCPENLNYSFHCNYVELTWEQPEPCVDENEAFATMEAYMLEDGVQGYTIVRDGEVIAENVLSTTYIDEEIPGGDHEYQVIAEYISGNSVPVVIVMDEDLINPVQDLTPWLVDYNTITLSWSQPLEDEITDMRELVGYTIINNDIEHNVIDTIATNYQDTTIQFDFIAGGAIAMELIVQAHFSSGCSASENYYIFIGVEKIEHTQLKLFPNPAKDHFELNCDAGIRELIVYDSQGKVVRQSSGNLSTHLPVNVSGLKTGLYFVSVKDQNGQIHLEKLMKY